MESGDRPGGRPDTGPSGVPRQAVLPSSTHILKTGMGPHLQKSSRGQEPERRTVSPVPATSRVTLCKRKK